MGLTKLILCLIISLAHSLCSVEHQKVWACIVKDSCINKYQLHAAIRHKTTSLRRQFLMAVEGAKYHRLYEDCDVNKDGCISMEDIAAAGKQCQRSCVWRQTMHDLLC
jgi:hypothetical protein